MELNYKELSISLSGNLSEMAADYKFKTRYSPVEAYLHPIDGCWHERDTMQDSSAIERDKVDAYDLLIKAVNEDGSINSDMIPEMKIRFDQLSNLFGAETYNGWDYEELAKAYGMTNAEAAVIDTGMFIVMKCYVWQNHTKLLTIN